MKAHGGADGLTAPFPWFGGKSRVSRQVWERLGNVPNYVEPFFGSGAVLLGRPGWPGIETVNDLDCYVANFWRALQAAPDAVARWTDWPVNEADLHARHLWLVNRADFRERMKTDPEYYDAKIAGWWVWGICQWIGGGWCAVQDNGARPSRRLPHLGNPGMGVHRKRPHPTWFQALAERLRRVRVCCGNWTRVLGPTPTEKLGITAILLDPPYSHEERDSDLYAEDHDIAGAVWEWAVANGDNPMLRIALCGYEGEHTLPSSWSCVKWKAQGGYALLGNGRGRENASRETVWFSPNCLPPRQPDLFEFSRDG